MKFTSYFTIVTTLLISACQPKNVKLEKLVFHSSICMGTCPEYHLEIMGDKTMRLHIETIYKNPENFDYQEDVDKQGYYRGKINESDFKKLDNMIQTFELDTMDFGNDICCDMPLYTIIIYYDGKQRIFKSMTTSKKGEMLVTLLLSICGHTGKKNLYDHFTIEGE